MPNPSAALADSGSKAPEPSETPVAAASAEPVQSTAAVPPTSTTQHRILSIKFLGKAGWARLLTATEEAEIFVIPPMYGRPTFSEEEMEALILGGASIAPEVVGFSYGAAFK